ncbi:MAG: triose-phosphate isomerase [Candidatus Saccharimonadales bacterium]
MITDKRTLVVGNWKMHLTVHQASLLVHRLNQNIQLHRSVEVVLAPSMLSLQPTSQEIDRRKFGLAAQDAYYEDEGGYTGEVSFAMISGIVDYVIVGHSARRIYFGETLETVKHKVKAAVRNGIVPIICVGETKEERRAKQTKQVLHDQVTTAVMDLTSRDIEQVVIAYEPIWAISAYDGEAARPEDVEKAVKYIRFQIEELYGRKAAERIRVIYGGSVDDHSAKAFLRVDGVDGVLPGAASLNYRQFTGIVEAAYQVQTEIRAKDDKK